ncbi:tryptophan synthase beta subunit-like PLP-dependent enzyme [Rickenella mellea]|uniref:Tryptophan synthase beta subunit-like PLP-dependent enzyme n=1 Tax=Rickenella mellea TaxID=50990 RepID=A0A4Y7PLV2_9AGAM|nr:tryptophan synthase beta subunit-like PLP-dependent enzyme [Rickenella mellea]
MSAMAFKIRGATNAILSLLSSHTDRSPSEFSIITHSSGNHAQTLAYSSRALGMRCHVVMPSNSASVKKDAVLDAINAIISEMKASGKEITFVPPYDDVRASSIDAPLDVLIAPVGRGGMLSGCAVAAKGVDPGIWVVGAEPAGADDADRSFNAKLFIPSVDPQTLADGLRTSLGEITFPLFMANVDAIHTILIQRNAEFLMKLVYERMKLVIEPSAAVGLTIALYSSEFKEQIRILASKKQKQDLNVGIIFSGGNVDVGNLSTLFDMTGNS